MRTVMLVLVLVIGGIDIRAAEPPDSVVFQRDVVYGTVNGVELKLNIARPREGTGKRPCVMVIHGGGWAAGDRKAHDEMTWQFASKGYVSATIGYRFAPKDPFPAQVQDVKAAARFLRANAEKYGIDPTRFGAVGFSAGAHLSMMLGTMDKEDGLDDSGGSEGHSSKVQAVVSYFGPTEFMVEFPPASKEIVRKFLGESDEAKKRASPVTYVSKGDAPMLLFQGTKDVLVPHDQAYRMTEALTKEEVPGRVELLIGAGHGWGGKELQRTWALTMGFFDEHLKPAGK